MLFLAVGMVMLVAVFSSCNFFGDPAARTPGYKLFTGTTDGFRISFEYPDSWIRKPVEQYGEKYDGAITLDLVTSQDTLITIDSYLNAANGGGIQECS